MNPVLLYFLSGESLYAGAALLLITVALPPFTSRWRIFRNLAAWLALIMMVMAAPPFPLWSAVIFLIVFGLWYFAWNFAATNRVLKHASTLTIVTLMFCAIVVEYPHRVLPKVVGSADKHLVVIGDSISSGLNPQISWPVAFEQTRGVGVRNLARVGATAADAVVMANQVQPEDRAVLIEIGGNDMIAGISSAEFSKLLEATLIKISSPHRTVVMMELPLLPYRLGYGRAQRHLAAKYGVWLVPKRYFVRVLAGSNATSDGLHLTANGARAMAELVARVFDAVLKSSANGS